MTSTLDRAQGCLMGQLAGDALGSLVEFRSPDEIDRRYPNGPRLLVDGGTWDTIAGQPTDDSEMALSLARMLVDRGIYDQDAARRAYVLWFDSGPFDCGGAIAAGLSGLPNTGSQANGALMRISPLGIFGANHDLDQVWVWAIADAKITHPHPICLQANALFATALAHAVASGAGPTDVYQATVAQAEDFEVEEALLKAIESAGDSPPGDYLSHQGWVLIAFQNALWQLLHAADIEEGVVSTVRRGGDTDTNAAICGALLGAVHGLAGVPDQWVECVLSCRPEIGRPKVRKPRPEYFWPIDALDLARDLVKR